MTREAEGFDIDELLGMACMVEVSHEEYEGKQYAKAVTFSSIPKGMTVPDQVNKSQTVYVDNTAIEEIEKLPDFIKKKITASKEYTERTGGKKVLPEDEINPEDIPF